MKIKSLLLACSLAFMGSAGAANVHVHPKANANAVAASAEKSAKNTVTPGYCQIDLINDSYDNVTVYGRFDDNSLMTPFNMYTGEFHTVDLIYYGACHPYMYLDIVTFSGYHIYSGYTRVGQTVRVVPYLKGQLKAEVSSK